MPTFTDAQLTSMCEDLFVRAGATAHNAWCVADHLVLANLVGHDSHGIIRIPEYLDAIRRGELLPAAEPTVVRDEGNVRVVDGHYAFGQVAARFASTLAIESAKAHKIALVAAVRHHHIGRLGHYAELAADEGMIAMIFAGGWGIDNRCVVPYGGTDKVFGGNPLALGFPVGQAEPVVLDMGTCAMAIGKVELARDKGETLAPGAIVDRQGRPSVDPNDYFDGGAALAFGGHKGSALALAVELLGGALVGSEDFMEPDASRSGFAAGGMLIVGIDTAAVRPDTSYHASAEETVRRIQRSRPAPGFDQVMTPGQPEQESKAHRAKHGIPVPVATWEKICRAAAEWDVELPRE